MIKKATWRPFVSESWKWRKYQFLKMVVGGLFMTLVGRPRFSLPDSGITYRYHWPRSCIMCVRGFDCNMISQNLSRILVNFSFILSVNCYSAVSQIPFANIMSLPPLLWLMKLYHLPGSCLRPRFCSCLRLNFALVFYSPVFCLLSLRCSWYNFRISLPWSWDIAYLK